MEASKSFNEGSPDADIVYVPGLSPEQYRDALETEILQLDAEDEEGNTHVIKRDGEAIGAATAYGITVEISSGREIHGLDLDAIDTDPSNYHSAYLAFVTSVIANDPYLSVINSDGSKTMTEAALNISPHLPRGWVCEYRLPFKNSEVTTTEPEIVIEHLIYGGSVSHSFKKIAQLVQPTTPN